MSIITISNHGPLIVASNYWGGELDRAGKLYVSVNAGCIRILVPRSCRNMIEECRSSKYAVLSRGPWPDIRCPEAVEIMFEDGSDMPFSLHLSPESFDAIPGEPEPGREWTVAMYDSKKGRPHKCLERRCYWRRVPSLPCLKPWEDGDAGTH